MALFNLSQLSVFTILLVSLVLLTAYVAYIKVSLWLVHRRFRLEHGCQPIAKRYPHRDPFGIDGLIALLKASKEHRLLDEVLKDKERLGNTYANQILGRDIIATHEPQNLKTILSLKFKDYGIGNRIDSLGALLGHGIFTSDGEAWVQSRALIRPNFTREQVADLDAFERHIQDLLKLLPRDGSTVDLQELFFRLTIDSATEFLFGRSVNSLRATTSESSEVTFADAFTKAQHFLILRSRLGPLRHFASRADGDAAIRICHAFVDQFVDEAVRYREKAGSAHPPDDAGGPEKYVFLRQVAAATTDKRRLRDELLNVLLAGRDTTASLLSNLWFEVARRPAVFAALRAEVDDVLPRRQRPSYAQLRSMRFLRFCLNESLRLHPPVPGNERLAVVDTVLPLGGGPDGSAPLLVRKGTIVSYVPYVMHRRKDLFGEDADEFRPERWEHLRPGWEYLPFNGGPRICTFSEMP